MTDPLSVECPDCLAPAAVPCHTSQPDAYTGHAARGRLAELRALEHGTCDLCNGWMVRGTVDEVTDAWHPEPSNCPPLPDPATHWNDYARAISNGVVAGHPGIEHFVPTPAVPLRMEHTQAPHPEPPL